MTEEEWRKSRLQALADEFGGLAELGRAYSGNDDNDGSYMGHLVAGRRPITEKSIKRFESLRGGKYRGWFTRSTKILPLVQPQPEGATMVTTREDADMSIEKCPLEPFVTHEQLASLSSEQLVVFAYKAKELLKEVREGWPVAASGKQREA